MSIKKALLRKKRKNESYGKYVFAVTHLWLGLLSSLVVLILCITGSVYAFKEPISKWINYEKIHLSSVPKSYSLLQIEKLLAKENKQLNTITVPADPRESIQISFTDYTTNHSKTHYFDPYKLEDLGAGSNPTTAFFELVLSIHRTLLIPTIGKQIVGISTLLFCLVLLSGIILWFPKKWKNLKQGLTIKWNATKYRLNYDLHNTLGFYSFLMLLFIALTGTYVTYPWMKNAFIISLGGNAILSSENETTNNNEVSADFQEVLNQMLEKENEKKHSEFTSIVSLDSIFELSQTTLPYEGNTTITLPNAKEPRFTIKKTNTNTTWGIITTDEMSFDKSGILKTLDKFEEKPLHKQFILLSKPLHTGEVLGLKSIIFYSIICLIGCSLPITGFIIWWKKI